MAFSRLRVFVLAFFSLPFYDFNLIRPCSPCNIEVEKVDFGSEVSRVMFTKGM